MVSKNFYISEFEFVPNCNKTLIPEENALKKLCIYKFCSGFHFLKFNIKYTVEALGKKKIKMEAINTLFQK